MKFQLAQLSLGSVSYRLLGEGSRLILFFHGFPGSSSQIQLFEKTLQQHNLKVLCIDRPGYNRTLIKPKNMIAETLHIANEMTSQLGWEKFEVVTLSGGTPFGIAFAEKFQQKVSFVRVICGLGYLRNPEIRKHFKGIKLFSLLCLPHIPGALLKKIVSPVQAGNSSERSRIVEFFYPTSEPDRIAILQRNLKGILNSTLEEALIQNALGPIEDSKVFLSDWGLSLADFKQPIHFWHGDEDHVISHHVSEIMTTLIPQAGLTIIPHEGHFSLPINRISEILGHRFIQE